MPISTNYDFSRASQEDFGAIAYEVMHHVFSIHDEFGRFFDERIYKRELANRMPDIALEVPITVEYSSFSKIYFVDLMVGGSGLFEFKSVDAIHPRHRSQTIHYLLLSGLEHAKLINTRPERVEHEFINCSLLLCDTRSPMIEQAEFDETISGASDFSQACLALVRDWGAGLETALYEEAITHLLGGEERVIRQVPVIGIKGPIDQQCMRLVNDKTAFKITSFPSEDNQFVTHARRLIDHTPLETILWANITGKAVALTSINRTARKTVGKK